jgi:hypothetical protein
MLHERTSRGAKLLAAAVVVAYLAVAYRTMRDEEPLDLCIFRAGVQTAAEGHSPYGLALIRRKVAQVIPPKPDSDFHENCGFFLPPQTFITFYPLAKTESWDGARALWFCVLSLFGFCCGTLAWTFGRDPARQGTGWVVIILLVLINPVTIPAMIVGQTGLLFAGLIALGQYCFESNSPRLGCFLWAVAFFKPHLALPFLVLAWLLGGWKRAAAIAGIVAVLNLLGALMIHWNLLDALRFCLDYAEFVGKAHKAVRYNLVAENYQILSWNRCLAAAGGPAIDLKVWMVLGGFALWAALVAGRLRLGGARRDPAYLLAVTTVGTLCFAQVLAYELILLVLLAPLILQHFDAGRKADAYLLLALIAFLLVPLTTTDRIADQLQLAEDARGRTLLRSHRCFGVAALTLALLIRGPARRPSPSFDPSSASPPPAGAAPPLPPPPSAGSFCPAG